MNHSLNPHISVDCVVFGFDFQNLKVLLIEKESLPGEKKMANPALKLPGSLVYDDELLTAAADRVLKHLTGLNKIYLEQFGVFDSPERIQPSDKHWLENTSGVSISRVISVAYYSLVKYEDAFEYTRFKRNAHWLDLGEIGELPFDHNTIIIRALSILRDRIKKEPVGLELLPKKFTIKQLQNLYEVIQGITLDNRNFRKKLGTLPYFIPLAEKQENVAHKPARLYTFDKKIYLKSVKENFAFNL